MLRSLSVQNYALIEELYIEFAPGINIITGETGAGKSILLGALSLVLGQRADTASLFNKDKKCVIEAVFEIGNYEIQDFFEKHELDYDAQTIVRREISPNNRSRAFINDTPVNNQALKTLASFLIDIHSQHNSLSLMNNDYQLGIVDDFARTTSLLDTYKKKYKNYQNKQKALQKMLSGSAMGKGDEDYYAFLLDELEAARLVKDEQEQIEKDLLLLNNTEHIKRKLLSLLHTFNDEPHQILAVLKQAVHDIGEVGQFLPHFEELSARINSAYIELNDIIREIEMEEDKILFSQEKLETLTERINLIYSLQKKHNVNTVEGLIEASEKIKAKIKQAADLENDIVAIKAAIEEDHLKLKKIAEELSAKRHGVKKGLEQKIKSLLQALSMPEASFTIEMEDTPHLGPTGSNEVNFKFSANKGHQAEDIAKTASGGEFSRLMLAVKSVVSTNKLLPALIFDEIDTGISGQVAVKTGKMLSEMSHQMQIIAITHLPQIASLGHMHYEVYKKVHNNKTLTLVRRLEDESRINAIASMISGSKTSEASRLTATELLSAKK